MRRGSLFTRFAADVREAIRVLARDPLFTIAAVLSLGLGIGVNTALFSVVNAVLLRPPPYEEPDHLVFVWNQMSGFDLDRLPLASIQIRELRGEQTVFEDVGGIWATTVTMSVDERSVLESAGLVTPNFLSILGVEPRLGRLFVEDEGTATGATVILSHEFWTQELGADETILGRTLQLEGGPSTVVGVLPTDFKLIFPPAVGIPERLGVYTALPWTEASDPDGSRFLRTVARTREGVAVDVADATVREVAERLRGTYPEMAASGDDFFVAPLQSDSVSRIRPILVVLIGGVAVFLLLTSVNVASLLLARGRGRQREFAVRSCLGASRGDLVGLLIAEITLLVTAGTAVGLAIGVWGGGLLWSIRPDGIARVDRLGLDPFVLGSTAAAAALAAMVAGFGPLARLRRGEPVSLLKVAGASARSDSVRARRLVTVVEIALSVVLVVGAGLVGRTLGHMEDAELGFQSEDVLTFRVGLSEGRFPSDGERARLAQQIEDELVGIPSVIAAGGGSHIPLADWANWSDVAAPEETPERERDAFHFDHRAVTPGFLAALGTELVQGRYFRTDDLGDGEHVVIVDQAYAERAFAGRDAVGRRVIASRYVAGGFVPTPAVIVGVIRDLRDHSPTRASQGQVFWPFAQSARWELTYAVRTREDPTALADEIRELVRAVHPDLGVADVRALEDYVTASTVETRFTAFIGALFSTLGLALAALGLYGVISYSTLQRRREFALHLALGARGRDLLVGVLREGLLLGAIGVTLGLLTAGISSRYLQSLLFEVSALDPAVFGGVGILILVLATAASVGPALRASRTDPVRSLRAE